MQVVIAEPSDSGLSGTAPVHYFRRHPCSNTGVHRARAPCTNIDVHRARAHCARPGSARARTPGRAAGVARDGLEGAPGAGAAQRKEEAEPGPTWVKMAGLLAASPRHSGREIGRLLQALVGSPRGTMVTRPVLDGHCRYTVPAPCAVSADVGDIHCRDIHCTQHWSL